MKKRNKKSPVTKEQLARQQEVARKRKIIVEEFYPALVQATVSVDEAKMLISAASSLLMEDVLQTMKERKFDEIYEKLVRRLTPDDVRLLEIEKLFATLKGENLFVAREIIEGMSRAIEHMVLKDLQGRKLDTLNADWQTMLN